MSFPEQFEPATYRMLNAELSHYSDEALKVHYERIGRPNGQIGCTIVSRYDFANLIPISADVLEIGPFSNPLIRRGNIKYFDVLDQHALIQRLDPAERIFNQVPHIDYVSPNGDLSLIDEKFDFILSSHCIEHQPNLISHLNGVAKLLRDGGYYFILAPDKRYCFDHYIPESDIVDIIAADIEQRVLHSPRNFLLDRTYRTHNDPGRHWLGDHGHIIQTTEELKRTIKSYHETEGSYVDVHAWRFTPDSFDRIIDDLFASDLCCLRRIRTYSTLRGGIEFFSIMQKC